MSAAVGFASVRANPQCNREFANAGLVYYKVLEAKEIQSDASGPDFGLVQGALRQSEPLYRQVFARSEIPRARGAQQLVRFPDRLTLGLGMASVHEIGFMFHPLYGVPFIPGSSLKGLASHYTHEVWGIQYEDPRYQRGGEIHALMFGVGSDELGRDDRAVDQQGTLVFHDALLFPEDLKCLELDIMTPHYSKYYTGSAAPNGMEDPVPVLFPVLRNARFRLQVTCPAAPEPARWADWGMKVLLEALVAWGIGGKTSSGYGRAEEVEQPSGNEHP
ncbi:MAG: type III-B CRISPR module RAMP protein Cmr6 [Alicyclobacillus sp.]|nr:type III-B CRISPR module RAMP protein Cmr6 [Alicyclobacillus sp.]